MGTYTYKLVTQENHIREGTISAFSKRAAEKRLTNDGSIVILISRDKNSLLGKNVALPMSGFSAMERILFFRNLAMMISAGLSMVEGLDVAADQVKSGNVKKSIRAMAHDIENGQKLSVAMSKFPKHFSRFLVETINVGEITGRLSETMDRIATDLEKDYELKRKVIGAMAYPIVVIFVMIIVATGLIVYVLPEIAKLFEELEAPLPLITRVLFSWSVFIGHHPFVVVGFSGLTILFIFWFLKLKRGRYMAHYALLRLPLFGPLIKEYNLALFFRAVEALLISEVSLVQAVRVAQSTVKNDVFRKAIDGIPPILLHGVALSEALEPFPFLFPSQTRKVIGVGERTGRLEEMFRRITLHYEQSVDHKTKMLMTLIEPILMVTIGIVVGGIAVSIFLPIYNVATII